jgi:uncharacterized membrane protein
MKNIPDKLKSRKLWVTIVAGLLLLLNKQLGLNLDDSTIQNIGITVAAYVLGQGVVDYGQTRERSSKYASWVAAQISAPPERSE